MPVYEYLCGSGHVFERILPTSAYKSPQTCDCGLVGEKVILHAPRVFGDISGYESPATGKWVEGRRARAADFQASGCRPYEQGEREEMIKRQEENEQQLDRVVDAVVESTLAEITG